MGAVNIPPVYVASFIIGIIFLSIFGFFFKYSSQGIYMRSVADNQPAALSLGVHVRRVFAMSGHCGTGLWISGSFWGSWTGSMSMISVSWDSRSSRLSFSEDWKVLGSYHRRAHYRNSWNLHGGYVSTSLKEVIPYIVLVFILLVKPYGSSLSGNRAV